jgi:hypothetical protein
MELKFRIKKYSQGFNTVGTGYREFTKFILVDLYVSFPYEGYNCSFNNTEFR